MRVMVVIFGGLDHEFLGRWDCTHLRQQEWGPVVVDELKNGRDVASQITAQLITGETWRVNGVGDRKNRWIRYRNPNIRRLEQKVLRNVERGRMRRHEFYAVMDWVDILACDYLKDDLTSPSLFDLVPSSEAVYVPGYNPEPSSALARNILNPIRYPGLGVEGALDLREKNYTWRRRRFFEALDRRPDLLVGQFQYIDSTQHLYLSYSDPERMDEVEAAYWRMDDLAREIVETAAGHYDRILFVSDNGAAIRGGFQPTHHNRPFYSVNAPLGLDRPNLRDFFGMTLGWLQDTPNTVDVERTPT